MAIKTRTVVFTYPKFAAIKPKIALDNTFNVGSNESGRWGLLQMGAFLSSSADGMNLSNIIIVDIDSCLDNVLEGSKDYDYFKKWKDAGFLYIAVDGNNRSITISKFFKDEVYLPTNREYVVEESNGRIASFQLNHNNNVYSKLPVALKNQFDSLEVAVKIVERATREEITKLFLRVNSGMPLNGQEMRNARISAVSENVRNIGYQYDMTVGSQIMSDKSIIRFGFHEFVASTLVYFTHQSNPITINSQVLDRSYNDNSAESQNLKRYRNLIKDILEPVANDPGRRFKKAKFKKFNLMNWALLVTYLNENNMQIVNFDKVLEWFHDTEMRRLGSSTPVLMTSRGTQKLYSELITDDAEKLEKRLEIIVKDLNKSKLFDNNCIIWKDPNRIFSRDQRYAAWKNQNGRCPLTGKDIPIIEIYDSSKWQADHILEHSLGGSTTVDNCQLVCAKAHSEKTAAFNSRDPVEIE